MGQRRNQVGNQGILTQNKMETEHTKIHGMQQKQYQKKVQRQMPTLKKDPK